MISVKAKISIYREGSRKTPIYDGYRPLFLFPEGERTTGHIQLRNQEELLPGESAEVIVQFLERKFLGPEFRVGVRFTFEESPRSIVGEGEILEIESMLEKS